MLEVLHPMTDPENGKETEKLGEIERTEREMIRETEAETLTPGLTVGSIPGAWNAGLNRVAPETLNATIATESDMAGPGNEKILISITIPRVTETVTLAAAETMTTVGAVGETAATGAKGNTGQGVVDSHDLTRKRWAVPWRPTLTWSCGGRGSLRNNNNNSILCTKCKKRFDNKGLWEVGAEDSTIVKIKIRGTEDKITAEGINATFTVSGRRKLVLVFY